MDQVEKWDQNIYTHVYIYIYIHINFRAIGWLQCL